MVQKPKNSFIMLFDAFKLRCLKNQVGSVDFKPVLGYYGVLRFETFFSFSGVASAFV